ncbi:MAG: CoB--CoM heterodisulfide reductase iron-sulfur subunit B family protein [Nitrospirae bacterium]|nr:CoB--CoM heterodisulfide reductase iron-sulfur subunit B family protein [Nitrospirota bacterium]
MKIAYYPGCSLHASSKLYDIQAKSVLGKIGIELSEIEDWNCCGATSASKTDDFLAIALAARNLGIADATGLSEMMIPCSSCYSRTLVSQKALAGDPALRSEINAELAKKVEGKIKISNILEVLLARKKELTDNAVKKLTGLKPACYYGCLLTRFPSDMPITDSVENPVAMEGLLKSMGAEPLDWGYKTDCCGASASVNDADMALKLMSKILKDALARGANCFVTTCPMCQLNLDAYQDEVREKYGIAKSLPVYFITELLGVSMGMGVEQMQIDRHFTDALGLLRELKLI